MIAMTITEFLLARIAEDEAAAMAATKATAMPAFGDTAAESMLGLAESEGADRVAVEHFQRHNPDRVLHDCKAKRRQIAHLIDFMEGDYAPWNETQLRMMAEVYANHPDYDPAWRP